MSKVPGSQKIIIAAYILLLQTTPHPQMIQHQQGA